jgi:hypothetical protein
MVLTAACAGELFCTAVPAIHIAFLCTPTTGERINSDRGSHIFIFSKSADHCQYMHLYLCHITHTIRVINLLHKLSICQFPLGCQKRVKLTISKSSSASILSSSSLASSIANASFSYMCILLQLYNALGYQTYLHYHRIRLA